MCMVTMYRSWIKRVLDFILSTATLIILSPILLVLIILGSLFMKGNPFFTQCRLGWKGKVFHLIKFRTMDNSKDKEGNLLSDEERVNKYGRFLRSTSLDELPELMNIFLGQMSIVGPRPLLVSYLPYYTEEESHRHDVRPGLTGLAQIKGRSFITWEEIFEYDLEYVKKCSFTLDVSIIWKTVLKVIKRGDIADIATITVDKNGDNWVIDNGIKKRLHKPLDVERNKQC